MRRTFAVAGHEPDGEAAGRVKAFSVATKLSLMIALLVIVSLGTMSAFAVWASRQSLREQVQSANLTAATLAARAVEQYIADASAVIREAPGRPKLRQEIRTGNWPEAAKVLENFVRNFRQFDYVFVQDRAGVIRVRVPHAETVGQDFSFRDFFREATRTRDLYVSGVYMSKAAPRPVVSIAMPVLDDAGSIGGVLVGALSLKTLGQFVSTIGLEHGSAVYVVDSHGLLIAHSGGVEVGPRSDVKAQPPVQAALAGKRGTIEFREPGGDERFLAAHVPITRLGWGVVAAQPVSVAYAAAGQLGRRLLWLTLGFTGVAVALGWGLARTLTGPLVRFAGATKRLGAGDFSVRVTPESQDEVAALALSFNAMAEQLQRRVAEAEASAHALRESEERVRLIIETSLEGVITMDVRGVITGWNTQAEKMFGWSREEALGRSLAATIIPERDRGAHARGLKHFLTTGEGPVLNKRIEVMALHRDGGEFPVELAICVIRSGDTVTFSGFVRDLTARKRAEREIEQKTREVTALNERLERRVAERTQQLEAANKELEAFTYTVSHDLKAPLRGMEGFARALQEDYTDRLDETGSRYLTMIQGGARRMGQLIDDLLRYSRLERREMRQEHTQLRPLVESLCDEVAEDIRARGLTVRLDLAVEAVEAEREGLREALANLIGNAVKFSRADGGTITIGSQQNGGDVVLRVADTGIGFDMRYHDRIFGIFERLHRQEDFPGTGVGLAIVRKVAERHGGRAWAVSEPGKGSTFYLALPGSAGDSG
jgi:PAS domain S-box-containing protein